MEKVDDLNCIMAPDMRKQMEAPNFSSNSEALPAEALTKRIELSKIREKDISFQPVFVDQQSAFLLTLKLAGRPKFSATLTEANFTSTFIDVSQVNDVMLCCLGKLMLPESNKLLQFTMAVELIQRQIPDSLPVESVVITLHVQFNSAFKRKEERVVITLQPEPTSELAMEITQLREEMEDGFDERDGEIAKLKQEIHNATMVAQHNLVTLQQCIQGCSKKVIWNIEEYELVTLTLTSGCCLLNNVQLFTVSDDKAIKFADQREQRLVREYLMDTKEEYRELTMKKFVNTEELQTLENSLMFAMFRYASEPTVCNLLNFVQRRFNIETVLQAHIIKNADTIQIIFYGNLKDERDVLAAAAVPEVRQVFVCVGKLSPAWFETTRKAYSGKALKTHLVAEGKPIVIDGRDTLHNQFVFEVVDKQ